MSPRAAVRSNLYYTPLFPPARPLVFQAVKGRPGGHGRKALGHAPIIPAPRGDERLSRASSPLASPPRQTGAAGSRQPAVSSSIAASARPQAARLAAAGLAGRAARRRRPGPRRERPAYRVICGGSVGLTSLALVVTLAVAAGAIAAALLWWWPRLAGGGIRNVAGRAGGVLLLELTVLSLIFVAVNRANEFYASWSDLLGTDTGRAPIVPVDHPAATGVTRLTRAVTVTGTMPVTAGGHGGSGGLLESVRIRGALTGLTAAGYVYLPAGHDRGGPAAAGHVLQPGSPGGNRGRLPGQHLAGAVGTRGRRRRRLLRPAACDDQLPGVRCGSGPARELHDASRRSPRRRAVVRCPGQHALAASPPADAADLRAVLRAGCRHAIPVAGAPAYAADLGGVSRREHAGGGARLDRPRAELRRRTAGLTAMGFFGLTSGYFSWLMIVVALAGIAGVVAAWPALARRRVRDVVGRIALLTASQLLAIVAVLVFLNSYFLFVGSWSELLGQRPSVPGQVRAGGRATPPRPIIVTGADLGPAPGGSSALPLGADGAPAGHPPRGPGRLAGQGRVDARRAARERAGQAAGQRSGRWRGLRGRAGPQGRPARGGAAGDAARRADRDRHLGQLRVPAAAVLPAGICAHPVSRRARADRLPG